MPCLVGVVLRLETRKEEDMKSKFSDKVGAKIEITDTDEGREFRFHVGPESAKFIEDLFKNAEDDESEELSTAAKRLIASLSELANTLAVDLKYQIEDGYTIAEFSEQSKLLCEILNFFKSIGSFENDE